MGLAPWTGLRCMCLVLFITVAAGRRLYWRSEELGTYHLDLPGTIKDVDKTWSVVLRIFIAAQTTLNSTHVQGYAFAESTNPYSFTMWGQPCQPEVVRRWLYPIMLKDMATGVAHRVRIHHNILAMDNRDAFDYPMLFEHTFDRPVTCVEVLVQDWLHSGQVCFSAIDHPRPLQPHAAGWSVWAVMTPWRGKDVHTFLQAMVHYVNYHASVGFMGTILYSSPFLLQWLAAKPELRELVRLGKLLVILWDRFNKFEPVVQGQVYYEVPDQFWIINHAILTFRHQKGTLLYMADIDEFFVPLPPARTVTDTLTLSECRQDQVGAAWGGMLFVRRNVRSSLADNKHAANEAWLWNRSMATLECNPLRTYDLAMPARKQGKQLVLPAGVAVWHVHHGIFLEGYGQAKVDERCGIILHAFNMWKARVQPPEFSENVSSWHWMLPNMTRSEFVDKCLPK